MSTKTNLSDMRGIDYDCEYTWESFDRAVAQGIYLELRRLRVEIEGIRHCPDVRAAVRRVGIGNLSRKEIRAIAAEVDKLNEKRKVKR